MTRKIIAYDLGTGGIKASLFDEFGKSLAESFVSYDTYYPQGNMHEQSPEDWWNGIIESSRTLIQKSGADVNDIEALAISGHSLGVVPIDNDGKLLREKTPIWSDTRAEKQAADFFEKVSYEQWYLTTGNGFPAACYSIFKILWYREHEPEMFKNIYKVIGTKDYCNYKLIGEVYTDHSYASGSGVYDLKQQSYKDEYIEAAGIDKSILPEIVASSKVIGTLTKEASELTGLPQKVKVVCGGVDNSCMALGARGIEDGRVYTSLGSSAWIAVTSHEPIVDMKYKPYVFAHVLEGMYASAVCIFSAGNSNRWVRDCICTDLKEKEEKGEGSAYKMMDQLAAQSAIGANKLIFNPSLAGGSMLENSPNIRGGFVGLSLGHTRADLIRATMEGIAMNLRICLDVIKKYQNVSDQMLIVGGGSKSPLWRQMFADIYELDIIKTNIDLDAASLGAAALAAVGSGIWEDYSIVDHIHKIVNVEKPVVENVQKYTELIDVFKEVAEMMAQAGERLFSLNL